MTDYERMGGEEALAAAVGAFVDRFFADFIIGFLFVGKDRDRIVRHEIELASQHLGGPHRYQGRPIGEVHRPLRINRGQFRRRLAIVRTVLREHGVPDDVIDRWIATEQKLERVVTDGTDCAP